MSVTSADFAVPVAAPAAAPVLMRAVRRNLRLGQAALRHPYATGASFIHCPIISSKTSGSVGRRSTRSSPSGSTTPAGRLAPTRSSPEPSHIRRETRPWTSPIATDVGGATAAWCASSRVILNTSWPSSTYPSGTSSASPTRQTTAVPEFLSGGRVCGGRRDRPSAKE